MKETYTREEIERVIDRLEAFAGGYYEGSELSIQDAFFIDGMRRAIEFIEDNLYDNETKNER